MADGNSESLDRKRSLQEEMTETIADQDAEGQKISLSPADIHILICEDDPVTRRIVKQFVLKCEYQATAVADGQEGLEALEANPGKFGLILSDVVMPRMTGLELLRRVRQHVHLKSTPVVMMSGTEESELAYRCLHEGADDYMLKPIRMEYIKGIWRNVWRKRRDNIKTRKLEEEQRKRMEMEAAMSSLQIKISEAIETPLSAIVRTVSDLVASSNLTDDVRNTLATVLQGLNSSQLYQPAFENFFDGKEVDRETKSWFMTQVNQGSMHKQQQQETQYATQPAAPRSLPQQTPQKLKEVDVKMIRALRSLDFDVWNIDEDKMIELVIQMFRDLRLLELYKIEVPVMQNFLVELRRNYRDMPYHNFRHAFDVTQMTYWLLTTGEALQQLSSLDVLVLMFSSLCHDIDHPGTNNAFQQFTQSDLALLYNDQSVLENHHSAMAFKILRNPEMDCNVFSNLTREEFLEARALMIKAIMATDLAHHVEIVARFESRCTAGFNKENADDRCLLIQILIKCADIANPLRPFILAKYWSDMILEEGFRQGEREEGLGLPISPFMDRKTCNQAKMSVGFIDFLVIPLYRALGRILPQMETCINKLQNNRYRWQSMLDTRQPESPARSMENTQTGGEDVVEPAGN